MPISIWSSAIAKLGFAAPGIWQAAFRAGRQPDTAIADNLATYALVEAAYESARIGTPIKPKHWP
jgi:hypothetical protein